MRGADVDRNLVSLDLCDDVVGLDRVACGAAVHATSPLTKQKSTNQVLNRPNVRQTPALSCLTGRDSQSLK